MIVRFDDEFSPPGADVYSYFEMPADWARLFGLAGTAEDLGEGWCSVARRDSPFPWWHVSSRRSRESGRGGSFVRSGESDGIV